MTKSFQLKFCNFLKVYSFRYCLEEGQHVLHSGTDFKKYVIFGGAFQVLITILICFVTSRQFGLAVGQPVFIGFLVSLSSTAIVLRLFQQKAEVESIQAQLSLGIWI